MGATLLWVGLLGLLVMPGPTNTLLLVGGATRGIQRGLPLLLAELSAYAISISALVLVIGPIAAASPAIDWGLRIAASLYLVYLARRLWHALPADAKAPPTVAWRHVFVTTLLNPKAIIIAIGFAPQVENVLAFLAGFAVLCVATGGVWVVLGGVLGRRGPQHGSMRIVQRGSAVVLIAFGVLLVATPALR